MTPEIYAFFVGTIGGAVACGIAAIWIERMRNARKARLLRSARMACWEDLFECAYWEFDARHKGYGEWRGMAVSERDAFKHTVRALVHQIQKLP